MMHALIDDRRGRGPADHGYFCAAQGIRLRIAGGPARDRRGARCRSRGNGRDPVAQERLRLHRSRSARAEHVLFPPGSDGGRFPGPQGRRQGRILDRHERSWSCHKQSAAAWPRPAPFEDFSPRTSAAEGRNLTPAGPAAGTCTGSSTPWRRGAPGGSSHELAHLGMVEQQHLDVFSSFEGLLPPGRARTSTNAIARPRRTGRWWNSRAGVIRLKRIDFETGFLKHLPANGLFDLLALFEQPRRKGMDVVAHRNPKLFYQHQPVRLSLRHEDRHDDHRIAGRFAAVGLLRREAKTQRPVCPLCSYVTAKRLTHFSSVSFST